MSCWTYVTGVIEVDTCARSDAEAMYLAQTVVNHLPRITGSERSHVSRSNCRQPSATNYWLGKKRGVPLIPTKWLLFVV